MQSQEQRKQVVARGLLHLLQARLDTDGRPLELPGGISERMDIPVPTRGVDMVEVCCQYRNRKRIQEEQRSRGRRHSNNLTSAINETNEQNEQTARFLEIFRRYE